MKPCMIVYKRLPHGGTYFLRTKFVDGRTVLEALTITESIYQSKQNFKSEIAVKTVKMTPKCE
jgi:hypothetical protein